jgi:hypothetical protein
MTPHHYDPAKPYQCWHCLTNFAYPIWNLGFCPRCKIVVMPMPSKRERKRMSCRRRAARRAAAAAIELSRAEPPAVAALAEPPADLEPTLENLAERWRGLG